MCVLLAHVYLPIAGRIPDIRLHHLNDRRADDFPYNDTSICLSYGIDFQHGGSYFIDVRSSESFSVVSQFSGCEANTAAYVLLVDNATGQQVECSGVATTPDWTNVISTCPMAKNEMSSGAWSVLVIGNNGDGSPYAWQRDFDLTVGVPVTSTTTSTVTFTETATPSTTVTTTSTIETTSTAVPNTSTITMTMTITNTNTNTKPAATKTITITPRATTITSTKWLTRTVNTWTFTQSKVTKTIIPTCTIPPRPSDADPPCRIFPTIIPLPLGLTISSSSSSSSSQKKKMKKNKPRAVESASESASKPPNQIPNNNNNNNPPLLPLQNRSPDAPTITIQAPQVLNTTTTLTLSSPTMTLSEISLTTHTVTITGDPTTTTTTMTTTTTTVLNASSGPSKTAFTTTTLLLPPSKTKTITRIGYVTVTRTSTVEMIWTYTTTGEVPKAAKTACREEGGNFWEWL